jgi:hypothetical protein
VPEPGGDLSANAPANDAASGGSGIGAARGDAPPKRKRKMKSKIWKMIKSKRKRKIRSQLAALPLSYSRVEFLLINPINIRTIF